MCKGDPYTCSKFDVITDHAYIVSAGITLQNKSSIYWSPKIQWKLIKSHITVKHALNQTETSISVINPNCSRESKQSECYSTYQFSLLAFKCHFLKDDSDPYFQFP